MKKAWKVISLVVGIMMCIMAFASCTTASTTAASSAATSEAVVSESAEAQTQASEAAATEAQASTDTAASGEKILVGVSISGFAAPYFKAMVTAMEEEAAKSNVELKVLDAEWDAQKQASQVESLIASKCDIIELVPCDSQAIIPTMEKVKESGIPLIVLNTQNDPESDDLIVTFVGASMEDEAALAAKSTKDILGDEGGKVVMIEGAAGSFPAIHRSSGYEAAIEGTNIEIIARQNAGWDRQEAMTVMEDFLTRYPEIDVVYAHDDNMAIGAIQAIKAAGRLDQIKVVSISGCTEGYEAVKAGEIYSTVSQPPEWEGMTGVQTAVQVYNGETVEKWIKTPIEEVTIENVDNFHTNW